MQDTPVDPQGLSEDARAVHAVLTASNEAQADAALRGLPAAMQERLETLSPMNYIQDIHAPSIVMLHDRGDQVIPVQESRQLFEALQPHGSARYTEMQFQHLDPVKGKLPLPRLAQELGKFFLAVYPIFPARGQRGVEGRAALAVSTADHTGITKQARMVSGCAAARTGAAGRRRERTGNRLEHHLS
jgi:hypothetical protein